MKDWGKVSVRFYLPNRFTHSLTLTATVIRQKGESRKGGYEKTKQAKFSKKVTFLTPWYVHMRARIGGKKCSFFGKFGVLCFLVISVWLFILLLPLEVGQSSLHKKWSFPLKVSSVNVTKSTGNCGLAGIYWRNP